MPQSIGRALISREKEKAAQDLASEVEEIRLALRSSFADLISHASAALAVGPDQKPKIFRDSLVSNLTQFFSYFDARNIADDNDLSALVSKAREVMQGVSPDELRSNMDLRLEVQQTMDNIKSTIDANVMLKPARRFIMDTPKQPTTV